MKTLNRILTAFVVLTTLTLFAALAVAQTETPDVSNSALPSSTSDFWTYAIAVVVPLIVGGINNLVPKLPKFVLPISTPFVGIALGALLKALGLADMGWVDMAQAGGLAVLVRESWNQIVTKQIAKDSGSDA